MMFEFHMLFLNLFDEDAGLNLLDNDDVIWVDHEMN